MADQPGILDGTARTKRNMTRTGPATGRRKRHRTYPSPGTATTGAARREDLPKCRRLPEAFPAAPRHGLLHHGSRRLAEAGTKSPCCNLRSHGRCKVPYILVRCSVVDKRPPSSDVVKGLQDYKYILPPRIGIPPKPSKRPVSDALWVGMRRMKREYFRVGTVGSIALQ